MKRDFLILLCLILLASCTSVWGNCPEWANDRGNCDTMYIQPWDADTLPTGDGPYTVRVPVYVTCDVVNACDSIAAFVIPLCIARSNPTKYCSLSGYWNEILWTTAKLKRSIFRHLPSNDTATVHNWMMDLYDAGNGEEWSSVLMDLRSDPDSSHFWLTLIPSGSEDVRFGSASHTLLLTMTFRLQDTMQICIDTCFWPPTSGIDWSVPDIDTLGNCAYTLRKIPRSGVAGSPNNFKSCFNVRKPADVREIEGSNENMPSSFSLSQNYPNPFNPTTNFQFTLPKSSHVKIEIFNIVGQKVATIVDVDMKPGLYTADWNGRDENDKTVSSGIYFYRMQAGDFSNMKKMVLVK
ncbi:MAG: T9SS type A sorting domain-containing protein [Parcubacteria group bacterium]